MPLVTSRPTTALKVSAGPSRWPQTDRPGGDSGSQTPARELWAPPVFAVGDGGHEKP